MLDTYLTSLQDHRRNPISLWVSADVLWKSVYHTDLCVGGCYGVAGLLLLLALLQLLFLHEGQLLLVLLVLLSREH